MKKSTRKKISALLIAAITLSMLAGCGQSTSSSSSQESSEASTSKSSEVSSESSEEVSSGEEIVIEVMQNKTEGADALEAFSQMYKDKTGITVEFTGLGSEYHSTLAARIASNDAPDMFTSAGFADFDQYYDKLVNLNDQPWVEYVVPGASDAVSRDGEVYGLPISIEGVGYMYNKTIFEEVGITELPNTLEELEAVCVQLEAAGIRPFTNAYAEFWVLMQNFTSVLSTVEDPQAFYDSLMAGETHFKDIPNIESYMDQIDITVKYGQANSAVAGDFTSALAAFVSGESAMHQQGTWAQSGIDDLGGADFEIGYIPIIGTDGEEDKLAGGGPMFWVISNESDNVEETKALLNWMVMDEEASKYLVDELKYLPATTNVEVDPDSLSELNREFYSFSSEGKVIPFTSGMIPGDGNEVIFGELQKYISEQISREQFYDAAQAKLESLAE